MKLTRDKYITEKIFSTKRMLLFSLYFPCEICKCKIVNKT